MKPRRAHHDDKQLTFEPSVYVPTITTRLPDGSVNMRAGKPIVLNGEDEISTAEAAKILGCEPDWVARMCDQGKLLEGQDWRRIGERGNYRIKRAAVIRHAGYDLAGEKIK